jgi:hypothetical protein
VSASLAALVNHPRNPLRRYVQQPAGRWGGMSAPQREFHTSQARKRASISANGIGKTYKGAAEAWWHMLGAHPHRDVPELRRGWVLCPDLKKGWFNISRVMRELEPPDVLDPACKFVEGIGYLYRSRKIIAVKGGGMMVGNGCKQDVMALEGDQIGWLWVDEPPTPHHWAAARARVDRTAGPIWLTATPINRPVEWLRAVLEGDPDKGTAPEPGWWVKHYPLNARNAPHKTSDEIQRMIDGYLPFERPQRIKAEWDGYAEGRWIPAFREHLHCFNNSDPTIPAQMDFYGGWDHGEKPGAEAAYLLGYDGFRAWVLGEYSSPPGSGPEQHAEGFEKLLEEWDLGLTDVRSCWGDVNSAGWMMPGHSVNQVLEAAFAKRVRMVQPPFRMFPARKHGQGSIKNRARLINNTILSDRLRVHESCRQLRKSLMYWMGGNDDLKHPIDGLGYVLQEIIAPAGPRPSSARLPGLEF